MSCPKVSMRVVARRYLGGASLVLFFVFVLTNTLLAQTGSDGSGRMSDLSQGSVRQAAVPAGGNMGGAPSQVVPYISLSERYDSNVLFFPGNRLADYVTNISAGARMNYRGDMAAGSLAGGLISEVYVNNPGLNYVGTNASLNAVLDDAVGKVVRGLGLSISDTMQYTPRLQAWLTPDVPQSSFISGIQAYRNNSLTNNTNILSTYSISPSDQVKASYSYEMMRFFGSQGGASRTGALLFNTNVHGLVAGGDHYYNRTDSIGVSYLFQQMSFDPSVGGSSGMSAVVNGAMATLRKSISRELTAEVSPGAAILTSLPGKLQWTMAARLDWQSALVNAQVSYTRGIFPGFFLAGGALISDVVTLSLSRNLTSQWSIGSQTNYSTSRSLGAGSGSVGFESYGESLSASYTLYPGFIATATATWDRFTYGSVSSLDQVVNRHTAMISFRADWE